MMKHTFGSCLCLVGAALMATGSLRGQTFTTDPTFTPAPTTLQAAINDLAGNTPVGGKITLSSGSFALTSTLSIPAGGNNIHIVGAGPGATIITYSGSSDAIKIGTSSSTTTSLISLENLTINVSGAVVSCNTVSTVGIHAVSTQYLLFDNIEIKTTYGCNPTGQTAMSLDGSGGFSAFTTILAPRIVGDFTTGLLLTGGGGTQTANATTLIGGAIVSTAASKTGTTGIKISSGDTTRAFSTDVENWGTGIDVAASSNGPFPFRAEGNSKDWIVEPGVNAASFLGASFSSFTDSGTNTTYLSNSNGGVVQMKLTGCVFNTGSGSPNGHVIGSPCDIYLNTSGGSGTTLYVKESASGMNTGWVGK